MILGFKTETSAQALACSVLFLGFSACAAECVSPDLAPGLCDRNGDLVADTPADKSLWLDPGTILIADVPNSEMEKRVEQAAPFMRHLEKVTGKKVTYFVAQDANDLMAAFSKHQVHVVRFNSGSQEKAVRCHGYTPLAVLVNAEGHPGGYQMEIIVPTKSPIRTAAQLKGRTFTFVDESSTSGFRIPKTLLAKDFKLEAGKDYRFDFSGRQDNSVMGIANGIHEAAAIANDVRIKLIREQVVAPTSIRVIYTSKLLPYTGWGVSHRMNPALANRIREAFLTYDGPIDALEKVNLSGLADARNTWIPKRYRTYDYKNDWGFMRDLSAASGTTPTCK